MSDPKDPVFFLPVPKQHQPTWYESWLKGELKFTYKPVEAGDEIPNHVKAMLENMKWQFTPGGHKGFRPGSVDDVLARGIPGFHELLQPCPLRKQGCIRAPLFSTLRDTIIHLNDEHRWPRERIADWLETLDHDLRFRDPDEKGGERDASSR